MLYYADVIRWQLINIQMASLSDNEHRLVLEILEVANRKYVQEKDINPRAVFNLLKILSAYN